MSGKKKLLLVTSEHIIDTKKVSFSYLFQDKKLDAFTKFSDESSGPYGYLWKTNEEGVYYLNLFQGGKGMMLGAPIYSKDLERTRELIEETFPDRFNMLCSKEVADVVAPLLTPHMEVYVLFSEEALITCK